MSGDDEMAKRLRNLPARKRYEVGYGKPPVATRFRKGVSGNPRGRPKGARNRRPALNEERLKDIILDEAYRMISVRDGGREERQRPGRPGCRPLDRAQRSQGAGTGAAALLGAPCANRGSQQASP